MNRVRKNRVQRLDPVQRSENWKRIIKKEESYAITNDMSKIRTARDSNNSDALRTALGGGLETTRSTNKRPPSPTSTVMSSVSTRSSRTGVSSASFRTSTTPNGREKRKMFFWDCIRWVRQKNIMEKFFCEILIQFQ